MEKQNIQPDKITKPIQLLGAWLVGLLTVNASFLFAAIQMPTASWQSGILTIAAILNVPIFIAALFVLQTKFRPELQEDSYYSTYLNNRTNQLVKISKRDMHIEELESRISKLETGSKRGVEQVDGLTLADLSFGVNVHLNNQDEIEEALSALGVEVIRVFGENVDPPDVARVAVSGNMPTEVKDQVFKIARNVGIEYYATIEPWEGVEEDVLFGAYGSTEGKITHRAA